MTSPLWISIVAAVLMAGLLIEALIFRAVHDDAPATYKLFAVRDKLIRLVVDRKIDRKEPHFNALYTNLTILLQSSRCISGPSGWDLAAAQGKYLAHNPGGGKKLELLPAQEFPESLRPVVQELREALQHLIGNHLGVITQMDFKRREAAKIQKAQARALLKMMPEYGVCRA